MYQKSFVLIKPDGVERRLIGRILQRLEETGLKIHALRLVQPTTKQAEDHYSEHAGKPFFPGIVAYLSRGPVIAMVIGGNGAISRIRTLIGSTTPAEAAPGTIRGDFCHVPKGNYIINNLIHASANETDAAREISLWFRADEVVDYQLPGDACHGQG